MVANYRSTTRGSTTPSQCRIFLDRINRIYRIKGAEKKNASDVSLTIMLLLTCPAVALAKEDDHDRSSVEAAVSAARRSTLSASCWRDCCNPHASRSRTKRQ